MVRQHHRGFFCEFRAGDSFLGADEELFAGWAGVFDPHPEESAFLAVDVAETDLVLQLDGAEEVGRVWEVLNNGFETVQRLVLAIILEPCQPVEVVRLRDVSVTGSFVAIEPVPEFVGRVARLALRDQTGHFGHERGIGAGLGCLGLGPLAGIGQFKL